MTRQEAYDAIEENTIAKKESELEAQGKKVTDIELQTIRTLNTEFNKKKMALGELELQKLDVIRNIGSIQEQFGIQEKKLIDKYGPDSVLNMDTGEITKKENGKDK